MVEKNMRELQIEYNKKKLKEAASNKIIFHN